MKELYFLRPGCLKRRVVSVAALGILGLLTAMGPPGCASDAQSSTGGRRVVLRTRVTVSDIARSDFTSAVGWKITLSEALVSAGPFYYFDGAPPLVHRQAPRTWRLAARLFGVSVAHAHPGHYRAGNALGQMLESAGLDLLNGSIDLPDGEGVTGTYRSARFTFAAPSGKGPPALGLQAAFAAGKAEKDGQPPRFFRAFADLSTIAKSASQGRVEGCELREVEVEGDGTVSLTINPKIWFDLVDFGEAEPGSAEAPADLPEGSQPRRAFVLGLTQLSAYKFSYASP